VKQVTRKELEAELNNLRSLEKSWRDDRDAERTARYAAEKDAKEVRQQFADLKERLANAESANQYMRGYIARLQEDDVVREDLVATGDPDGEQVMRPKRKHTSFMRPEDYRSFEDRNLMGYVEQIRHDRDRPKPKHWVTY
jgi:hypothetical protein